MAGSDKPAVFYGQGSATGDVSVTSTTSSTAGPVDIEFAKFGRHASTKDLADIEKAVYSHIQAVRTLGRDQINTLEIAQALSLPQDVVIAAVARLHSKGVRVAG